MYFTHPEFRNGLAEEHVLRLAQDMSSPAQVGRTRQFAARLLLAASRRLAGEPADSRVERLVDEPVREFVVLAAHRGVCD
jgi:hypothetical protein